MGLLLRRQAGSNLRYSWTRLRCHEAMAMCLILSSTARADSVNSPNITLNVDTNRVAGAGAGNVSVVVNTITIAETTLPEYSTGAGKLITLKVQPGYQFDPSSNITAVSATIGINNFAANTAAPVTPFGNADEVITFNLTSGAGANTQDIIRINGIRLRILNAAGAAGPAQTTMKLTTSSAGGAFTDQGIVAANISRGVADHLVFATQPGNNQASADLLPAVSVVDFGGNLITDNARTITLSIQSNPGSASLLGTAARATDNGVATWLAADHLRILSAATGYAQGDAHGGKSPVR